MAADMVEAAVLTAAEEAAFMEAEVASMVAAALTVAEGFRGEEALLAAEALAEAAGRLAAGVPRDRALAADHSVARSAAGRSAERSAADRLVRNAVDNLAGQRPAGLAHSERVPAIRRRWAEDARADSAATVAATLERRAMLATESPMERGIRSAAEVAVQAPPQEDSTRLI